MYVTHNNFYRCESTNHRKIRSHRSSFLQQQIRLVISTLSFSLFPQKDSSMKKLSDWLSFQRNRDRATSFWAAYSRVSHGSLGMVLDPSHLFFSEHSPPNLPGLLDLVRSVLVFVENEEKKMHWVQDESGNEQDICSSWLGLSMRDLVGPLGQFRSFRLLQKSISNSLHSSRLYCFSRSDWNLHSLPEGIRRRSRLSYRAFSSPFDSHLCPKFDS